MSKQHANKKNNQAQAQTRHTGAMDKDSQRKVGAHGTSMSLDKEIDEDQIGNADRARPAYQASGRFQQDQLDEDEVGNRAQNQNYDRAVHGGSTSSRNVQQNDDSKGQMAGSKDTWNDDKSSKAQSSDKQTPAARNFSASSKDTANKEDQRRAGSKGDTSSTKR